MTERSLRDYEHVCEVNRSRLHLQQADVRFASDRLQRLALPRIRIVSGRPTDPTPVRDVQPMPAKRRANASQWRPLKAKRRDRLLLHSGQPAIACVACRFAPQHALRTCVLEPAFCELPVGGRKRHIRQR